MIKRTLLFTKPAYLSGKAKQLVVKTEQQATTIPAEDIGMVVLENPQVTLSRGAIELLLNQKAVILSCDSSHHPQGMMLPLEGHSELSERYKFQLTASEPLRKQLWKQTIEAKIANQAGVLACVDSVAARKLKRYSQEVQSGDSSNLEARAANHYWTHLFSDDFLRARKGPHPNSWLNYGYAIIRAAVARGLVIAGLLPAVGIFHRSKYNAFCLADDIMEPYRPYVDFAVIELMENPFLEANRLDKEVKVELLKVLSTDVMLAGRITPLFNAVVKTTASLSNCFMGTQRKILYPTYAIIGS